MANFGEFWEKNTIFNEHPVPSHCEQTVEKISEEYWYLFCFIIICRIIVYEICIGKSWVYEEKASTFKIRQIHHWKEGIYKTFRHQ